MGSTSSASAKDGERNRNMQRHVALASVCSASYNYKLYEDSAELAKRSQKLLCSPAVDLRHLLGQHEAPLERRLRISRACSTPPGHAKPAPSLSGKHRRHAQRRTATSMPKTALPSFLWRRSASPLPIPVYFMRSVGSTVAVFFWETPTRPTCKWLGTISVKCTCMFSRRCASTYNCGFYSFEQCYETVRGVGGSCRPNFFQNFGDGRPAGRRATTGRRN